MLTVFEREGPGEESLPFFDSAYALQYIEIMSGT